MGFFSKLFGKQSEDSKPVKIFEFNYFYAFEYVPTIIKNFNNGLSTIEALFDVPKIIGSHPDYSSFARNIQFGIAASKKYSNLKLFAISIPHSQAISQVEAGIVIVDEQMKFANFFTMEISFNDEYAIVSPFADGDRENYGFIKTPSEFADLAVQIFVNNLADVSPTANNPSANTRKANNDDDRIDNIQILLEAGLEWFQQEFFPLSEKAKFECILLVGSTLIRCISEDDIVKAICRKPEWNEFLDYSSIKLRLLDYQQAYDFRVASIESPFRMRLVDFAKKFGKMKIANMKPPMGNEYKLAVFIDADDNKTFAYTSSLSEKEVEPSFISLHKNDYGIRQMVNTEYELFSYSKEEAENLSFFALISNYLLVKPLEDIDWFNSNDGVGTLACAGYNVDVVLDKAMSAFMSMRNNVYMLGKELCILPEAIPTMFDVLP